MTRPALEKAFSFRKKIIVLFFVLIIVPFVFFAYYSYNKSLEGISKANASFSLDYLLQSRNNFDDYLRKINGSINDIIGTDKLQEMLKRVPKNVEEDRQFTLDMINFIYQEKQRVDAARIRIYPATLAKFPDFIDSLDDGRGITDERWFREEMKSGKPTWSLFTAQDNAIIFPFPIITLTKKFTSLNNEIPLGIIAADIDEDRIQRFIAVPQVRLGQEAFLLNEDGVVLSHPDKQLIGKTISSPELINLIQTKEQGTSTIQINHTDMLVTYVKLSELPGTIVSAIPLSILTESLKEIQRLTLYFLIGYILSCIGVIIYITFYFSNPIVRLVRSMRNLETGDFSLHLPASNRGDEIGLLHKGLNQLVIRIQELIAETLQSAKTKKELEYQVLSHQINPHFLYNTLESIRWKAEQHHMKDISEMVASLGNLLRLSLNQGNELTTVSREIEHVKAYIHIERMRLDKPFRVLFLIDEDIQNLPFLRLLLQPLVENAIHHGIRGNPEKGKIVIRGSREGNELYFEINDNGEGISEAVVQTIFTEKNGTSKGQADGGVGFSNVNERLILYFGIFFKLQFETKIGQGTKIIIRHPILSEDDKTL